VSPPVFISYCSTDQNIAETICKALESRGCACWISGRDIRPGHNFQESIVKAIRSAKVMLLVFTSSANNSDEIKKELALAGQHHLTVIPVRVEDVILNDAFAYEFATRQWIDLFRNWEGEIERLALQVKSAVAAASPIDDGGPANTEQPGLSVSRPTGAKTSRPSVAVLLSVLATAAVGIGGLYVYTRQNPTAPRDTIVKEEPPIGQLPTGAALLVDDGTCPPGQVKQIIGGNVATHQSRIRSCIRRP
jgi:TIR domain-containing protein/uncharacterized protein DUF6719